MPNGVDALVHPVQSSCGRPVVHRPFGQAPRHELGKGHDPVLPRCKVRDWAVPVLTGGFPTKYVGFRPVNIHAGKGGVAKRASDAQIAPAVRQLAPMSVESTSQGAPRRCEGPVG